MCYGDDARPPAPPVRGEVGDHGDLVLTSADGTQFAAYHARPAGASSRAIVILPDVRGLHSFYKELAHRFAEAGVQAIAFDYFGRTAGAEKRGDDFEYMPHVEETTHQGLQADIAACVAYLRGAGCQAIFTVGFCFGGRNSWLAAASGHGLAGAIGFYGRPAAGRPSDTPGAIDRAGEIAAPILALQGGDDPGIPVEESRAFDDALTAAGVEHQVVIYDGAPHSFFDRKYEEFAADSEDAWNRVLAFIERYA